MLVPPTPLLPGSYHLMLVPRLEVVQLPVVRPVEQSLLGPAAGADLQCIVGGAGLQGLPVLHPAPHLREGLEPSNCAYALSPAY